MPYERASDRLKRILVLVPWVIANPGTPVDDLCARFRCTREELSADLQLLFMCGLPPFGPGDLMEVEFEEGFVSIRMADYLAKPPRLTRGEALALLVMGRALMRLPGFEEADSLERALDKLAVAMAPTEAEGAEETAARIEVELASAGAHLLGDVRQAIEERARLHITYFSEGRAEMSERDVDPLLAYGMQGQWYLAAFDHMSGEERLFRIDRIRDLKKTGATFERPPAFDPARYERAPLFTPSARDLEAAIEVAPSAGWMREFVPFEREEHAANGWTRLVLRTPHLAWLVRLLLQAGPSARAVSPPELVAAVHDAAERTLERYEA